MIEKASIPQMPDRGDSSRGKRHTAKPSPKKALAGVEETKIPYGSRDVRHVPTPDPSIFWPFDPGQLRVIGTSPLLTFQVNAVHGNWIEGTQVLGSQTVHGELHLNFPVVIMRDERTSEPLVTLTLRRIAQGKAFLQVTANHVIPVGTRQ